MKKLFTLIFTIFNLSSYAIDINNIDIGDGYYAILGSGQSEYSYVLNNNKLFEELNTLEANTINNNFYKIIVVRINKSNNSLKIRLNDNSIDWCNVKYILTKNEMQKIKNDLNTAISNERERNRKYCCCDTTMTNQFSMKFDRKVWIEREKCSIGWIEHESTLGGLKYHPGICTKYSPSDFGSCR